MDTKKVHALLTAVSMGSLTSAAAELGYTQSGLTHMMNSLENELGINLLIRNKTGVHLSSAGIELLPDMRALLNAADALESRAQKLHQRSFNLLRLGAYTSVSRQWLPAILSEFRRVCPETEVTISVGTVPGTYGGVKNDLLDCAIVNFQESLCHGMCWESLWDDELLAVLPGDYPLKGDSFPVEDFHGTSFLMPSAGFDMDINPVFSSVDKSLHPRISYTNLDDAAIVSMVQHGLGTSILSRLVMQGINNNVLVSSLSPPAYRKLGIIMSDHRRNDKQIQRFIRCAQSVIYKMYNSK